MVQENFKTTGLSECVFKSDCLGLNSNSSFWEFPDGPRLELNASNTETIASIPGQVTKIPHASQHSQGGKKRKKKFQLSMYLW